MSTIPSRLVVTGTWPVAQKAVAFSKNDF